ncbi:MAG TPA: methylmalonyl-CoA mutase family protein, partial [Anaerolineales bacterium]
MTLEEERKKWEQRTVSPEGSHAQLRKPEFQTPSGIPLPPLLTPADLDPDYLEQLGFPGEYPFTRGVQPTMYRGRLWTMRQYAGYASAEESNRRY